MHEHVFDCTRQSGRQAQVPMSRLGSSGAFFYHLDGQDGRNVLV